MSAHDPDIINKAEGIIQATEQLERTLRFKRDWGVCPSDIVRIKLVPVGREWERGRRLQGTPPIEYHSVVWTKNGEELFMPANAIKLIEGEFEDRY